MEPTYLRTRGSCGNAYPFETHLAVVEVDRETCVIRPPKYFAVDDIGKAINPLVVDGQVHGAVVHRPRPGDARAG